MNATAAPRPVVLQPLAAALLALGLAAGLFSATGAPTVAAPALPKVSVPTQAAPSVGLLQSKRFVGYFTPFRTDRAALSPDGKYLAYTDRDHGTVSVVVLEIDRPQKAIARIDVATDASSSPMMEDGQRELTPAAVRWMRWVTPTRLVLETNGVTVEAGTMAWQSKHGIVLGVDADGGNFAVLATPRDVAYVVNNGAVSAPRTSNPWSNASDRSFSIDGGFNSNPQFDLPAVPSIQSISQDLHVADLDPANPGSVFLQTLGPRRSDSSRRIGYFRLDGVTGKLKDINSDYVSATEQPLLDRQGNFRLSVPDSLVASLPHRYFYHPLGLFGRSRELDRVSAPAGVTGFRLEPATFFGERSVPLGFDEIASILYYASNNGRDTFGIYSIDVNTGRRAAFTIENPGYDLIDLVSTFPETESLVFDRFTRQLAGIRYRAGLATAAWLKPELQFVQKSIATALPGHSVNILEWDARAERFLAVASSPGDAGAFYVFDRTTGRLAEFIRRAPWIDAERTHRSIPFSFTPPHGITLTGLFTVPNRPRRDRMPVVVFCPSYPWESVEPDYQSRVQAFANMGFFIIQLNGRGTWGFGQRHRAALAPGYDVAQVEDILHTLDFCHRMKDVDTGRVALMGDSHGAYLALRALQLHPERFRCAVTLNAPVNLADWLALQRWTQGASLPLLTRSAFGPAATTRESPLTAHPEQITKPALLLHYAGREGEGHPPGYAAAESLVAAIRKHGTEAELADLTYDYMKNLPHAYSAAYEQIEEFLNVHIYDYNVKLGDAEVKTN